MRLPSIRLVGDDRIAFAIALEEIGLARGPLIFHAGELVKMAIAAERLPLPTPGHRFLVEDRIRQRPVVHENRRAVILYDELVALLDLGLIAVREVAGQLLLQPGRMHDQRVAVPAARGEAEQRRPFVLRLVWMRLHEDPPY